MHAALDSCTDRPPINGGVNHVASLGITAPWASDHRQRDQGGGLRRGHQLTNAPKARSQFSDFNFRRISVAAKGTDARSLFFFPEHDLGRKSASTNSITKPLCKLRFARLKCFFCFLDLLPGLF